jgi:hypothetical protein
LIIRNNNEVKNFDLKVEAVSGGIEKGLCYENSPVSPEIVPKALRY